MGQFRRVHMTHCGPLNDGLCKYGDEDCPACEPSPLPPKVSGDEVERVARAMNPYAFGPIGNPAARERTLREARAAILAMRSDEVTEAMIERVFMSVDSLLASGLPIDAAFRHEMRATIDRAMRSDEVTEACCKGGPQWGHALNCPTLP